MRNQITFRPRGLLKTEHAECHCTDHLSSPASATNSKELLQAASSSNSSSLVKENHKASRQKGKNINLIVVSVRLRRNPCDNVQRSYYQCNWLSLDTDSTAGQSGQTSQTFRQGQPKHLLSFIILHIKHVVRAQIACP